MEIYFWWDSWSTLVVAIWGMMMIWMMGQLKCQYFDQIGSIRAQMKSIGGGSQIIYAYLLICCNFFIYNKIILFEGQHHKKFNICIFKYWSNVFIFWERYLINFPLAKSILIWRLYLNTIELLAKSRVFENVGNFLENSHFCTKNG